ncbi:hypothetical protein PUN28_006083 [Cardiocondyla obscurior]|uniref:Uncharacterized protein n=1 Tax=Cardiocondyla obscurior TaxID=286306 RepID=A0AAW2G8R6_9HYME
MKRGWKEMIARSSVVLTCPGQGYPVPSFRNFCSLKRPVESTRYISLLFIHLEPVSGAIPKVPPTAKITVFSVASRTSMAMLCQAQANPLPVFRYADVSAIQMLATDKNLRGMKIK